MKRTPPPPCKHLTVTSSEGRTYRCVGCGEPIIVMATSRAAWAELGRRLQGGRRVVADKGQNAQKQLAL